MSITSTRVQASRPQDYLYDPLYTVSCYRDHMHAWSKAQNVRAVIVPNYGNMFSQVPTHPPHSLQIRVSHLDPNIGQNRYVPIDAQPQVTGANRYKYFRKPLIPYTENPGGQLVYVRQPNDGGPVQRADSAAPGAELDAAALPAAPVSVGVQTLYRESEAQTDPYSPEYVVTAGTVRPEILALAHLTHRAGLPAGVPEIEMIERARAKRAWEATLPEVRDEASFQQRLRMMEAMELQEWEEREREIKRLQDRRLAVLAKVLHARADENERQAAARMHHIWQRKLAEKDALKAKIDARRAKELRKLAEKRKHVEGTRPKRDIIAEYASYTSPVYLPKARDGIPTHTQSVMDSLHTKRTLTRAVLNPLDAGSSNAAIAAGAGPGVATGPAGGGSVNATTAAAIAAAAGRAPFDSLVQLESLFPPTVTQASLAPPAVKMIQTPAARREAQMLLQLDQMDAKLKAMKHAEEVLARPLRFLRAVPKPVPRAPTPTTEPIDEEEENRHQRALLIQRWLRGRAEQDAMHLGKAKRQDLINELRLELELARAAAAEAREEERMRLAVEAAAAAAGGPDGAAGGGSGSSMALPGLSRPTTSHGAAPAHGGAPGPAHLTGKPVETAAEREAQLFEDHVQAAYVGQQFDYLDKELRRLEDQRRLAALAKLAERTRRMREAQESGMRQRELARREAEDHLFRQVLRVHQETVDSFLEDVVLTGVADAAEMRARERVRDAVERFNSAVASGAADEAVTAAGIAGMDKDSAAAQAARAAANLPSREAQDADETTAGTAPANPTALVSNLVSSFLFPETERRMMRDQVATSQQRHLLAAHRAIYGTLADVESRLGVAGAEVPVPEDTLRVLTNDLGEPDEHPVTASEVALAARLQPDLAAVHGSADAIALPRAPSGGDGASEPKPLGDADALQLGSSVPLPRSEPPSRPRSTRPASAARRTPSARASPMPATAESGTATPVQRPPSSHGGSGES
ncbi:hypothetical protein H9P43_002809 [Blastocladiella emersonii ATCC 22665]|nr:hypothetical protein H9P43_002809 [Blastocladiella emersonii ATCC 22665]